MINEMRILVADDLSHVRLVLIEGLKRELKDQFQLYFEEADSAEEAYRCLVEKPFDIALLDIDFSESHSSKGMSGLEASLRSKELFPHLYTVAVSSHESHQVMERAIKEYQMDWYIRRSKVQFDELSRLCRVAVLGRLHREGKLLPPPYHIETRSPRMIELLKNLDCLQSEAGILIYGETGTGKELLARRAHANSVFMTSNPRRPLEVLDCSSLSKELFESEVFGHVKGAFTGAAQNKVGILARVDGGDLFIDEIQNIPLHIQQKLLRVLNDGVYTPVGSELPRQSRFRVIAATNQPIEWLKSSGKVLPDFLARLDQIRVHVPPLRERPEDIPGLLFNFSAGKGDKEFTPDAMAYLSSLVWRENVRELKSVVDTAISESRIPFIGSEQVRQVYEKKREVPYQLKTPERSLMDLTVDEWIQNDFPLAKGIEEIEKHYVKKAIQITPGLRAVARKTGFSTTKVKKLFQSLEELHTRSALESAQSQEPG